MWLMKAAARSCRPGMAWPATTTTTDIPSDSSMTPTVAGRRRNRRLMNVNAAARQTSVLRRAKIGTVERSPQLEFCRGPFVFG